METNVFEKIIAILIFPLSFLYASWLFESEPDYNRIMFGIFTLLVIIIVEAIYWKRKRNFETYAMLLMTVLGGVSVCFDIGEAWDNYMKIFFTHLFAVYYILVRSGRLAEGETSHMMVWDGITGFCVMPFKNWPLNVRTIGSIFKTKKDSKAKKTVPIVLLASFVAIILFFIALNYLRNADDNYNSLMEKIGEIIKIDWDFLLIPKLILTALAGTWLYGLIGGCFRETEEQVRHRGDNIKWFVGKLRKVPGLVWVIFIGLFSVFYAIFFFMQGSYLWGAFAMKLPEGFTYSEYARKGFGEMCGVMVVNFILLWLSTRTAETYKTPVKIACTVLNAESMIFALIAFLKIFMYIYQYGFTPLRLESIWAATVLFLACVAAGVNMLTEKKTARIWFYVSALSLAGLCLV